jgi:hypothetical protein
MIGFLTCALFSCFFFKGGHEISRDSEAKECNNHESETLKFNPYKVGIKTSTSSLVFRLQILAPYVTLIQKCLHLFL